MIGYYNRGYVYEGVTEMPKKFIADHVFTRIEDKYLELLHTTYPEKHGIMRYRVYREYGEVYNNMGILVKLKTVIPLPIWEKIR
jgi:hypothetical protein